MHAVEEVRRNSYIEPLALNSFSYVDFQRHCRSSNHPSIDGLHRPRISAEMHLYHLTNAPRGKPTERAAAPSGHHFDESLLNPNPDSVAAFCVGARCGNWL